MARKNSWRENPYWHWAWPYADESRPQYQHMAHVIEGASGITQEAAATIYLPDPDSRSGWQLHHIYPELPAPPPPPRKLGY